MPRRWRIVTPAPRTAALALAGPRARERRGVLAQLRNDDSAAVYRDGEPVALVMFRNRFGSIQMALCLSPDAVPHLRRLVRLAQLTLDRLAHDRPVVARVRPGHRPGERMAAMVGFRRVRAGQAGWWVYRRGGQ
jgi:hypothetical protein